MLDSDKMTKPPEAAAASAAASPPSSETPTGTSKDTAAAALSSTESGRERTVSPKDAVQNPAADLHASNAIAQPSPAVQPGPSTDASDEKPCSVFGADQMFKENTLHHLLHSGGGTDQPVAVGKVGLYLTYNPLWYPDCDLGELQQEFTPEEWEQQRQQEHRLDEKDSSSSRSSNDEDESDDEILGEADTVETATAEDLTICPEDSQQARRWKLIQQLPMFVRAKLQLTANTLVHQQIQFYEYLAKVRTHRLWTMLQ